MARDSGEETFAVHWCCFVHCRWPVGGNSEFTGVPQTMQACSSKLYLLGLFKNEL